MTPDAAGRRRPTISDVAGLAGVSKSTVSTVMSSRGRVAPETRARVEAAVQQLGWRPGFAARGLSSNRPCTVGLVVRREADAGTPQSFHLQLISGLESVLPHHGMALQLRIGSSPDTERRVHEEWSTNRSIAGIFALDLTGHNDPRLDSLQHLPLPVVAVAPESAAGHLPWVWADDHTAARSITRVLHRLGHRHIGFIGAQARSSRLDDLRTASAVQQMPITGHLVAGRPTDAAHAARLLLSGRPRPTALVCDNDWITLAASSVAAEMGIAVPGQLSLLSWNDSPLCTAVHPQLAALSPTVFNLGARAAQRMLALLAVADAPPPLPDPPPAVLPRGTLQFPPPACPAP